jgi:UDP-N-acetylglucosamine acyltransferase
MPVIDPTARVDARAEIAADVEIGPYCVVGPHVAIGSGCKLLAQVHITGHTAIGPRTRIAPFASLGTPPQSVKYRGGPTKLVVGAECDIRECVTMNTGTEDGGGITTVGDRCFLMVGAHVGHDCHVGNDVTMANNSLLGGHAIVGNFAVLGGQSALHQFVRMGEGAMLAGYSGLGEDLIPFGMASGRRAVLAGLNVVGMKRRGYSREEIHLMRRLSRVLFLSEGTFRERVQRAELDFASDPVAQKVLRFIANRGTRPLLTKMERGALYEREDTTL